MASGLINKSLQLKCLFGYHDYTIPWQDHSLVLLCKHCKRSGYKKFDEIEYEAWYEFNENGNIIHWHGRPVE